MFGGITASGQPVASFSVPSTACLDEYIFAVNNSVGASAYQWDFCPYDLDNLITNENAVSISGFSAGYGFKLVEDNGLWYGFAVQRTVAGAIYRLDYGDSPLNTPTVSSVGNPDNALVFPLGIDLFKSGEKWYGFVGLNNVNAGVVRLDFGNSLTNVPSAQNLGMFGLSGRFWDVRVVDDGGNLVLVLPLYNVASSSIVRVNYRDSFLNPITIGDHVLNSPSFVDIRGASSIDVARVDNDWVALVSSNLNNTVVQFRFTSGILSVPVQETVYASAGLNQPTGVRILKEGSRHVAVIGNQGGGARIQIVNFHDFDPSNTPGAMIHDNLPPLLAVAVGRYAGESFIGGVGNSNSVRSLVFKSDCGALFDYSEQVAPNLHYTEAGEKEIELRVTDSQGLFSIASKKIVISSNRSPDIYFESNNVCAGHNVHFTPINQSGDIGSYTWDFGDGTILPDEPEATATHSYITATTYYPVLTVTAFNGCQNTIRDTLKIFDAPTPDFTLPSGLVCTNNPITFTNTTSDNYDGNLLYAWYVQEIPVSDTRDLLYSFSTTGNQTIDLVTSIPGCSTRVTRILPSVHAGPLIDFSFEGQCATEAVLFTTEVSEAVTDHSWFFDDGTSSTEVNPLHQFAFSGMYQVTLTATSPNGCNNSSTQEITIFSKPTPDFSIQTPPLACSGVTTPFSDLTPDPPDGDLVSWLWRFGESTETVSTQDAGFNFATAGDYDVSLTVTTDGGCSASIIKPVTIYPSPLPAISQTPACLGKPTTFTAVGDEIQSYYWEIGTVYYEDSEITHTFQNAGDHPLMLTVYGDNNCTTTLNQTVNVPLALTPNFSLTNHCVGYETAFTDITEDDQDLIASREWNFAGVSGESSASPIHVFNSVGEQNVSLTVTTGSGCIYATEKTINVLAPPIASFSASPETGAAPLEVQFTNTSTNASEWLWTFNDPAGSTSADQSPIQVFTEVGDYEVELLARNSAGCESRSEKIFSVVTPLPGVDLKLISTSENSDGSIKVIVTIENKGNTFIKDLPVEIDISGNTSLTEIVEGPIAPGSLYNLVLSYSINRANNLDFLCAEVLLENDLATGGNRMCIQFDQSIFIFHPYPNPATHEVRFEWISPAETELTIQLSDSFGKTMLYEKVGATVGLNQHQIDVSELPPGVYFVILKEKRIVKTYRIVVSGQN